MNIHLTKGAANVDAAYAYMDAAISKAAQDKLKMPPTEMFPTNKEVALTPGIEAYVTRRPLRIPRLSGLGADQQEPPGLDPQPSTPWLRGRSTMRASGFPYLYPDAPAVGAVLRVAARPSHRLQLRGCEREPITRRTTPRFLGDPFNFRVLREHRPAGVRDGARRRPARHPDRAALLAQRAARATGASSS